MAAEESSEGNTLSPKQQKFAVNFAWNQPDFASEVCVVDLILGHAVGANNDIFEMYMEGTRLKENTPLSEHRMNKLVASGCTTFSKEIDLARNAYQFLFRVENINKDIYLDVSDAYEKLKLVSGRTVNFREIDAENHPSKQSNDEFLDVNESSPLVAQKNKNNKQKRRARCGCAPGNCSVL